MAQITNSHSYLQQNYNIPTIPPSNSKFKGLKKFVARCIAYFTNAQNEFNANVVRTLDSFQIQLEEAEHRSAIQTNRISDISKILNQLQSQNENLYNINSQLNVALVRIEKTQNHHGAIVENQKNKINDFIQIINETQKQIQDVVAQINSMNNDVHGLDNRQNDLTGLLNSSFKQLDNRQNDLTKKTNDAFEKLDKRQDDLTKKTNDSFNKLNKRQDDLTKKSNVSFNKLNKRQDDLTKKSNVSFEKLDKRQDDLAIKSNDTFEKLNNRQNDLAKKSNVSFEKLDKRQGDLAKKSNDTFKKLDKRQDDLTKRTNDTFNKLNKRQDDLTKKSNDTFEKLDKRQDDLTEKSNKVFNKLNNRQHDIDKIIKRSTTDLKTQTTKLNAFDKRVTLSELGFTKLNKLFNDFSQQISLLSSSLNNALTDFSSGKDKAKFQSSLIDLQNLWNDVDYVSYENACRGSNKLITERLSYYLKCFNNIKTSKKTCALDLGCGRGEFVELLNNNKIHARGVDLNKISVQYAKSKNINVKHADIFKELNRVKPGSLPAVSAFHLVEHLTFTELQSFLHLTATRLKTGGILLIETPNILNLQVAASDFYKDPTHIRPVHPLTLEHWLKHSGFSKIKIEFLHPFPPDEQLTIPNSSKVVHNNFNKLNDLIFGARDCAIIAVK